jgi:hypothetical protein
LTFIHDCDQRGLVGKTKNVTRGKEMEFSISVILRICRDFILAAISDVDKVFENFAARRAPWIRGAQESTEG